jgi:enoyl-CoA hydratase/carnithine racemase
VKLAGDVALLHLNNGKANAIDVALLDKLDKFIDQLDDVGAKAAVITGYDRFFSAGLSLPSLIALERAQMHAFITRFSHTMLRLYESPLPIVAAVNGHAIAGGCVLALMCDRRYMSVEGKIGLNEVQLGIGLPSSVLEPLRAAVSGAALGPIAQEGRLFTSEEARAIGLVDEVVAGNELESRAVKVAQMLAELNRSGWSQIKRSIRRPVLEAARRVADEETERWLDSWFSAGARRKIIEVVGKLEAKR